MSRHSMAERFSPGITAICFGMAGSGATALAAGLLGEGDHPASTVLRAGSAFMVAWLLLSARATRCSCSVSRLVDSMGYATLLILLTAVVRDSIARVASGSDGFVGAPEYWQSIWVSGALGLVAAWLSGGTRAEWAAAPVLLRLWRGVLFVAASLAAGASVGGGVGLILSGPGADLGLTMGSWAGAMLGIITVPIIRWCVHAKRLPGTAASVAAVGILVVELAGAAILGLVGCLVILALICLAAVIFGLVGPPRKNDFVARA